MELAFLLLPCLTLSASVRPASAAAETGLIESLLFATHQRPWLWGVYVFTVGLPLILFVSLMWPDKRFGPPDQQYYYKKSDDAQPDGSDRSAETDPLLTAGRSSPTVTRRRDARPKSQRKSDLDS